MTLKNLSTYPFPKSGLLCYYHTGSVENALDIVQNSHLIGSVPTRVNDPDDLRMYFKDLEKSPYLRSIYRESTCRRPTANRLRRISKKLASLARGWMDKCYRFVCMADAQKIDAHPQGELHCWKEYAGNFCGVRFLFSLDAVFLRQPSATATFFDEVSYMGKKATLDCWMVKEEQDFRRIISSPVFLQDLMYDKVEKWAIEYEYRLGSLLSLLEPVPDKKTKEINYFFKYNLNHLLGVDIGAEANPDDKEQLIRALPSKNIFVRTASLSVSSSGAPVVCYQTI